jgi:hypothetical protein
LIGSPAAQSVGEVQASASSPVDEIYIARSVREAHFAPTELCSEEKIGFVPTNEDQFTFRSTASRGSDGRVLDTNVQTIGSIHACFGQTPNSSITDFYGEGLLDGMAYKGLGECRVIKPDFPERGLYPLRCYLDLSGLPLRMSAAN